MFDTLIVSVNNIIYLKKLAMLSVYTSQKPTDVSKDVFVCTPI